MYKLLYHPQTVKQVKKLPQSLKKKIILKTAKLMENPFSSELNIKKLIGTKQSYRLRIGDILIIYQVDSKAKIVYIAAIGFRGQIY